MYQNFLNTEVTLASLFDYDLIHWFTYFTTTYLTALLLEIPVINP